MTDSSSAEIGLVEHTSLSRRPSFVVPVFRCPAEAEGKVDQPNEKHLSIGPFAEAAYRGNQIVGNSRNATDPWPRGKICLRTRDSGSPHGRRSQDGGKGGLKCSVIGGPVPAVTFVPFRKAHWPHQASFSDGMVTGKVRRQWWRDLHVFGRLFRRLS